MKQAFVGFIENYFGRTLDFRVRLFNVLAMAGTVVSLLMGLLGALNGAGLANIVTNLATLALSLILLVYSRRTGRYQFCYTVTIVAIFLVLFPLMFFSTGAYYSGMPCFFVFAVAFTIFMLEGKRAIFFSLLEIAVYVGVCLIAFWYPETVNWYETEQAVMADVVIAVVTVSGALGISMFIHFRIYNQQQKQLDEQNAVLSQINRQKAELLSNISHEIRTPLTVMSGYAQRARNQITAGTADDNTLRGLLTVQLEAQRLAGLAQQLLDSSVLKADTAPAPVAPQELVEQAANLVQPILDKHGNRLAARADDGCPQVLANTGMVAQVLVNLCVNANRHTRGGQITLGATPAPEGMVAFTVADDGDGIDEALLPRLFERGVSGDGESGLGLAICKEVVESHGGVIGVVPRPGGGTLVTFTLPQAR